MRGYRPGWGRGAGNVWGDFVRIPIELLISRTISMVLKMFGTTRFDCILRAGVGKVCKFAHLVWLALNYQCLWSDHHGPVLWFSRVLLFCPLLC